MTVDEDGSERGLAHTPPCDHSSHFIEGATGPSDVIESETAYTLTSGRGAGRFYCTRGSQRPKTERSSAPDEP